MESQINQLEQRYQLGGKLGSGGSGDAYLAFDRLLRRNVVIKRLRPDGDQDSGLQGILEEAGKMAAMRHPNVVGIYDIVLDEEPPCIVMEHVDGENLDEWISRKGPMSPVELVELARQTLDALAAAHAVPLIHRDLKPSNIMISQQPNGSFLVKLLDFGMAKFFQGDAPSPQTVAIDGSIRASISFISPEQLNREPVDPRCDLYSLGCSLYFAVTGTNPFPGDTIPEVITSHLNNKVLPARQVRAEVGQHLNDWLMRLMRRDPAQRFGSAPVAFQALLEAASADGILVPATTPVSAVATTAVVPLGKPSKSLPVKSLGVAAAAVVLLGVAAFGAMMAKPSALGGMVQAVLSGSGVPTHASAPVPKENRDELRPAAPAADVPVASPQPSAEASPRKDPPPSRVAAAPVTQQVLASPPTREKPAPVEPETPTPRAVAVDPQIVYEAVGSNTIGAKLLPELMKSFLPQVGASDIRMSRPLPEETLISFALPGKTVRQAVCIRAHGSSTAFKALGSRTAEIGMSSRPVKGEEVAALAALGDMHSLACEHVIGLDGLAIIVHPSNPLSALTVNEVAKIFTGEITDWSQVGGQPGGISIYSRDDKSGTFDTFSSMVLGKGKLRAGAKRFEDSNALSDQVAADPGAIGFIGLPYVRNSKALAMSDVGTTPRHPSPFTVATEDYVLSRRLFLYSASAPSHEWTRPFLEFVQSDEGQQVVGKVGFVPQMIDVETIPVRDEMVPVYREFLNTTSAQRLSLAFRFRSSDSSLDGKATRDLDRVVAFLARSENRSRRVHLLGFSDSIGGRSANLKLSKDRAASVANDLANRGVPPTSVRAMGSIMPVASNETQEGRNKNRRVEVWIE